MTTRRSPQLNVVSSAVQVHELEQLTERLREQLTAQVNAAATAAAKAATLEAQLEAERAAGDESAWQADLDKMVAAAVAEREQEAGRRVAEAEQCLKKVGPSFGDVLITHRS